MADHCMLIIKVISLIRMNIWSILICCLLFLIYILTILRRGMESGGEKFATVGWLMISEYMGLEGLFLLSLREKVWGRLICRRLLNSALNISSSGLIGLQISMRAEAEFMAAFNFVESDLRDEIWAHRINAVISAAASATMITCNILPMLLRWLNYYKIRIHFQELPFC